MLDDKVILHSNFTHFNNLIHETRYHGNRGCSKSDFFCMVLRLFYHHILQQYAR